MFCCLSPHPNRSLNERDLQVMKVFADLAANQMIARTEAQRSRNETRARIDGIIEGREFSCVYQPIWDFRSARPVGFEALCRFAAEPYRPPDKWFCEAFEGDLGVRLELAVLESALEGQGAFPDDIFLAVNASPETILSDELPPLLRKASGGRIVLEMTEHARVDDYVALRRALACMRATGVRLAIDDAGAGFASLQHVLQLSPDIIKPDMSLTRGVDTDPARRALAAALIFFAREIDCQIIAEGIETEAELETLKLLGVTRGQGYFLGRPIDANAASALLTGFRPTGRDETAFVAARSM